VNFAVACSARGAEVVLVLRGVVQQFSHNQAGEPTESSTPGWVSSRMAFMGLTLLELVLAAIGILTAIIIVTLIVIWYRNRGPPRIWIDSPEELESPSTKVDL
jgi:hypothetical protein